MDSGSGILGVVTKKLTGAENYAEWKYQMENFLLLNDQWQYVDEFVKFDKDDAKQIAAIRTNCKICLLYTSPSPRD